MVFTTSVIRTYKTSTYKGNSPASTNWIHLGAAHAKPIRLSKPTRILRLAHFSLETKSAAPKLIKGFSYTAPPADRDSLREREGLSEVPRWVPAMH